MPFPVKIVFIKETENSNIGSKSQNSVFKLFVNNIDIGVVDVKFPVEFL